jgi:hypothetical protein
LYGLFFAVGTLKEITKVVHGRRMAEGGLHHVGSILYKEK